MGKKSRKVKAEPKLKTEEVRRKEIDEFIRKLKDLDNIYDAFPEDLLQKMEEHVKTGCSYYEKRPWKKLNRDIELILTNKDGFQNKVNLLYHEYDN